MLRRGRFLLLVSFATAVACGERSDLDVADAALPDAGGGLANVSPTRVDFGLVDCGKFAPAQTVTVSNHGAAAFSFSAALLGGASSPYTISPTSDVVAPGGNVEIVIWPSPIPAVSDVTPNLYGDTLEITTTAEGDTPHDVPITQTARGAILSATTTIQFGETLIGSHPILPLTITNDGDIDATVTITPSPPFYSTSPSAIVAAKSSTSVGIGYLPDPSQLAVPAGEWLALTTDAVLCGAPAGPVPMQGTPTEAATSIGGSYYTFCAAGQSGGVYCWGQGADGALGNGTTQGNADKPALALATGAKSIAGSYDSFCVSLAGGAVQCWGEGPLGNGGTAKSSTPVNVTGLTDAKRVIGGGVSDGAFCAIRQTGQLVCWGYNGHGKFGAGYTSNSVSTPILAFGGVSDVVDASLGPSAACIVRSGGGVQCAGYNYAGNLGNGNTYSGDSWTPVDVIGIDSAVGVDCTFTGACAVLNSGDVECWGNGSLGSLGDGLDHIAYSPVFVSGLHDAVALTGGYDFTCALRSNGAIACWGQNPHGTLGDGSVSDSNVPMPVSGITTATGIVAGDESVCAMLSNGNIQCWGDDGAGQLGNGTMYGYSTSPVPVVGFP